MHHNGLVVENNNLKDDFILKCEMHTNACIYACMYLPNALITLNTTPLHALTASVENDTQQGATVTYLVKMLACTCMHMHAYACICMHMCV